MSRHQDDKVTRCGLCGQWTYAAFCTLCGPVVRPSGERSNTVNPALTANRPGLGGRYDQA